MGADHHLDLPGGDMLPHVLFLLSRHGAGEQRRGHPQGGEQCTQRGKMLLGKGYTPREQTKEDKAAWDDGAQYWLNLRDTSQSAAS